MHLYLVRHAEAKSEEEDPSRPLAPHGEHEIGVVASHLARLRLHVERIFHSGKLRARQTAGILAESLGSGYRVKPLILEETKGLAPLDDPAIWAARLSGIDEDTVLVGHLPHLGRLSSLLLCGDPENGLISFSTAGVVCLERAGGGGWSVTWMITPAALTTCVTEGDLGSAVYEGDAGI